MDGMRYSNEEWAKLRLSGMLEREIHPLDHRINLLRRDIRNQIKRIRELKIKGFPTAQSSQILALLCSTLAVQRNYRKALYRQLLERVGLPSS
jgi:hypothetical protein